MKKLLLVLLTVLMFIPFNVSSAAITPSTFKPAKISIREDGTVFTYTDSYGTTHKISYGQADDFKKGFRFLFSYYDSGLNSNGSSASNVKKDSCLKIEHFENVS